MHQQISIYISLSIVLLCVQLPKPRIKLNAIYPGFEICIHKSVMANEIEKRITDLVLAKYTVTNLAYITIAILYLVPWYDTVLLATRKSRTLQLLAFDE